jgi:hypothetical protein
MANTPKSFFSLPNFIPEILWLEDKKSWQNQKFVQSPFKDVGHGGLK